MAGPNLIVLYVENAAASAAFYTRLTGASAVAGSENFIAFPFAGVMLGLWARHKAIPAAGEGGAQSEIGFMVETLSEIEALYTQWQADGVAIAQPLTTMDFGPTFVALDPDGHRIRVCLFDK